uniref:Uncharacterized protein n=1 Tax=Anguilla anguilla TaxID=7936 RepID=A0A0E9QMQ8_ANGAN
MVLNLCSVRTPLPFCGLRFLHNLMKSDIVNTMLAVLLLC